MIIYIFLFSETFLLHGRGHENHEARNAALECTQSAYNLKYHLRML